MVDTDKLAEENYANDDPEYQNDSLTEEEQYNEWINEFTSYDYETVKDDLITLNESVKRIVKHVANKYGYTDNDLADMVLNLRRNYDSLKGDINL